MAFVQPPAFLQRGSHNAAVLRRSQGSLLTRAGVIGTNDLVVTASGSGMSLVLSSGKAWLPSVAGGGESDNGFYNVYNDSGVGITLAGSDALRFRTDLIYASVQDSAISGSQDRWSVNVLQGAYQNAGDLPIDPVTPVGAIAIAQVYVGAGVSTILQANIRDRRTFALVKGAVDSTTGKPSQATVTPAGLTVTLADGSTVLEDLLATRIKAQVRQTAVQTLLSGADNVITFQVEDQDTDNLWVASAPTRFTIRTPGLYYFSAVVRLVSTSGTANREVYSAFRVNGDAQTGSHGAWGATGGPGTYNVCPQGLIQLNANDYVELIVFQNSGGNASTDPPIRTVKLSCLRLSV